MINISIDEFSKLKFSSTVDVTCDCCGCQFKKTKRQLYHRNRLINTTGFSNSNSCSKHCQNILQNRKIKKQCICGKTFECIVSSGLIYCSRSCASKNRIHTNDTKEKMSNSLRQYYILHPPIHKVKVKICSVCKKTFVNNKRRTCSIECRKQSHYLSGIKGGRVSASKTIRRSKSEINLFNLLSTKYKCLSNTPMFNGWDADIIIPQLKLAILWNGVWHYSKVKDKHSVKQVQNRDFIKLGEIVKCGFNFIIVKDYKNKMTPAKACSVIENCITNNIYNITLF